mmetsp:Transcript_43842/g.75810  ORF Transcript_43842/g.75810 Transcript_43842/m.75810 type:complete len:111 (-) Transcript_43842:24-356(-)
MTLYPGKASFYIGGAMIPDCWLGGGAGWVKAHLACCEYVAKQMGRRSQLLVPPSSWVPAVCCLAALHADAGAFSFGAGRPPPPPLLRRHPSAPGWVEAGLARCESVSVAK